MPAKIPFKKSITQASPKLEWRKEGEYNTDNKQKGVAGGGGASRPVLQSAAL